jgi:hypothetical protein
MIEPMPGRAFSRPPITTAQRRHLNADQPQHAHDAKSAQHAERARRRDQRDADNGESKMRHGLLKKPSPVDGEFGQQFDDENGKDGPVDCDDQRAGRVHRRGHCFQSEADGVDDDQCDDRPLETLRFDEGLEALHGNSERCGSVSVRAQYGGFAPIVKSSQLVAYAFRIVRAMRRLFPQERFGEILLHGTPAGERAEHPVDRR